MNSVSKMFSVVICFTCFYAFSQKTGNGGNICDDAIRSQLRIISQSISSQNGIELAANLNLGAFYEALARGLVQVSYSENAPMVLLGASGENSVFIYNPKFCENRAEIKNLQLYIEQVLRINSTKR